MKMKNSKIYMALLVVFFSVVVLGSIAALSLNAAGYGEPLPDVDGRWASVCCGPNCGIEGDFCKGTGTYTCCK